VTQNTDYALARSGLLPDDFGDGWMTGNARDLMRIGLIAGFDAGVLARRLARAGKPGRMLNAATVERVLGEMDAHIDSSGSDKS